MLLPVAPVAPNKAVLPIGSPRSAKTDDASASVKNVISLIFFLDVLSWQSASAIAFLFLVCNLHRSISISVKFQSILANPACGRRYRRKPASKNRDIFKGP
jgi:hypothetical protein